MNIIIVFPLYNSVINMLYTDVNVIMRKMYSKQLSAVIESLYWIM